MKRKKTVTPRSAAVTLGIRLDSIYKLIWAGNLTGRKKDGRWMISETSLEGRLNQKRGRNA
jgi:hypothetical protein